MTLFIAKYGRREALILAIFWAILAAVLALTIPNVAGLPILGLIFTTYFFRDPERIIPSGTYEWVSPADGTIADIEEVQEAEFLRTNCLRIGIFLSVFDVHINRSPCDGLISNTRYTRGRFHSALSRKAVDANESNTIVIQSRNTEHPFIVRQIAGALARRIVCEFGKGDFIAKGQKIGMIKLGSRTELWIPKNRVDTLFVKVGDKVMAGETILLKVISAGPSASPLHPASSKEKGIC